MSDERPSVPVLVPDIGARAAVRVGQWLVPIGQPISEGDRLVELLADGVLWNVPSPATGTVASHDLRTGRVVKIGQQLGEVASSIR